MAFSHHLWSFPLTVEVTTVSVPSPLSPLMSEGPHFGRNASVNLNWRVEEIMQQMEVTKGG